MTSPDTRAQTSTLRTSDNASDPAVSWKVKCLNCGAALAGPFCAECGQRAVPPHPTLRQLAGDALAELSGWDGKLAESIRLLLQRPGELTRQWIEGRRMHFISPLRLYLTASLVYFVVTAAAPNLRSTAGGIDLGMVKFGANQSTSAGRVGAQARAAVESNEPLTGAERDSALADIAQAPAVLRPMLRRAVDEPAAFTTAIRRAMPNVFLALVPVFALIVALLYRRRNYPEHLYFAIHLFAFVFLARTLGSLALFPRMMLLAVVVQTLIVVWIAVYGVKALRRVYGGTLPATIAKGVAICVLYALVAAPVILAVAFIAAS